MSFNVITSHNHPSNWKRCPHLQRKRNRLMFWLELAFSFGFFLLFLALFGWAISLLIWASSWLSWKVKNVEYFNKIFDSILGIFYQFDCRLCLQFNHSSRMWFSIFSVRYFLLLIFPSLWLLKEAKYFAVSLTLHSPNFFPNFGWLTRIDNMIWLSQLTKACCLWQANFQPPITHWHIWPHYTLSLSCDWL